MKKKKTKADLQDSRKDEKYLQGDEATLDLPDVVDIPGQEHIQVPPFNEFADTTISSEDEEGTRIFEEGQTEGGESTVSAEEREALQEAAEKSPYDKDERNLKNAKLDQRDDEGELLNERIDHSGSDLDVPGTEDDDDDEEIGEEDEENNPYSLDSEDEDNSISK
jgi:hypothetical protein